MELTLEWVYRVLVLILEYDFSELFNPGRGPLNENDEFTRTTPFRFGLSINLF